MPRNDFGTNHPRRLARQRLTAASSLLRSGQNKPPFSVADAELPYPLPSARGFGSRLTSILPLSCQSMLRRATDHLIGERHHLEITQPVLSIDLGAAAPDSFRIGLLADFHYDPLHEAAYFKKVVDSLNELAPDLVFLLGDFASHDHTRTSELAQILSQLQPAHGTYAILGNHDHLAGDEFVTFALQDAGLTVLRNDFRHLDLPVGRIAMAAFDSPTYRFPRFDLLDQCLPGERAVVLCHEPDVFVHTALHHNAALQLSGHTHGGQVMLPLIGSPLLPRLGKVYVRGHYRRGGSQLYVNRGLGTGHLHVRWRARPEITLLTVRNSARHG